LGWDAEPAGGENGSSSVNYGAEGADSHPEGDDAEGKHNQTGSEEGSGERSDAMILCRRHEMFIDPSLAQNLRRGAKCQKAFRPSSHQAIIESPVL
jgi:hypothetical protein